MTDFSDRQIDNMDKVLGEAHELLHKIIGIVSDRDAAHGEIVRLMRRIQAVRPSQVGLHTPND